MNPGAFLIPNLKWVYIYAVVDFLLLQTEYKQVFVNKILFTLLALKKKVSKQNLFKLSWKEEIKN